MRDSHRYNLWQVLVDLSNQKRPHTISLLSPRAEGEKSGANVAFFVLFLQTNGEQLTDPIPAKGTVSTKLTGWHLGTHQNPSSVEGNRHRNHVWHLVGRRYSDWESESHIEASFTWHFMADTISQNVSRQDEPKDRHKKRSPWGHCCNEMASSATYWPSATYLQHADGQLC